MEIDWLACQVGRGALAGCAMTCAPRVLRFVALMFFAASPLLAQEVRQVYAANCASCHGPNLEGGLGGNLVDDTWKHGADDESITRVIREGAPDNGMPAFGATLNDAAVRALVVYIREMGARAAERGTVFQRPTPATVTASEVQRYRLEVVTDRLEVPWSIAFLPDGRMLVTERAGRLRVIEDGKLRPEAVQGTPAVWAQGQGGLMAVAVHPDYAAEGNGWIYLAFSDPGLGGTALTAIVRGRLRDGRWMDQQDIFRAPAALYKRGGVHFGCRLVLADGYLYFTIGERGAAENAQDLTRPNGKVHRVHDDGRVPADNPFAKTPGAFPTLWTCGNRNPQGLAREPATGALWETEHGPRGGDELNLIQPGRNYGWPLITYGMNYNGTPMTAFTKKPGLEQPVLHWTPSIAVGDMAFYDGARFPQWKGNLFVTALAAEELRRLVIEDGRVTHQEVVFKGIGRVRAVTCAPDGFIYLGLEGPGRVVRLVPSE